MASCESGSSSRIDPVLAGVGGSLAALVGIVVGYFVTKHFVVDRIFSSRRRKNSENVTTYINHQAEDEPRVQVVSPSSVAVKSKKFRTSNVLGRRLRDLVRRENKEDNGSALSDHDDEDSFTKGDDEIDDDVTSFPSPVVIVGVTRALRFVSMPESLARVGDHVRASMRDDVAGRNWTRRRRLIAQVFHAILTKFHTSGRLDEEKMTAIVDRFQQRLVTLRRAPKSPERDDGKEEVGGQANDASHIKKYVECCQDFDNSLRDLMKGDGGQLRDMLTSTMLLIEENITALQTLTIQDAKSRFRKGTGLILDYFSCVQTLAYFHRIEVETVTSLVDDVNAMLGDDDEDEAGDVTRGSGGDYRSGTDAIFGRAVADLQESIGALRDQERKVLDGLTRRRIDDALPERSDVKIEEIVQEFFRRELEEQDERADVIRNTDDKSVEACRKIIKVCVERAVKQQNHFRRRFLAQIMRDEPDRVQHLLKRTSNKIKDLQERYVAKEHSLMEQLVGEMSKLSMFGDDGDDEDDDGELMGLKLMRSEAEHANELVNSQIYLPQNVVTSLLDRHRAVTSIALNDQSASRIADRAPCDAHVIVELANHKTLKSTETNKSHDGRSFESIMSEAQEKLNQVYHDADTRRFKQSLHYIRSMLATEVCSDATRILRHMMTSQLDLTPHKHRVESIKEAAIEELKSRDPRLAQPLRDALKAHVTSLVSSRDSNRDKLRRQLRRMAQEKGEHEERKRDESRDHVESYLVKLKHQQKLAKQIADLDMRMCCALVHHLAESGDNPADEFVSKIKRMTPSDGNDDEFLMEMMRVWKQEFGGKTARRKRRRQKRSALAWRGKRREEELLDRFHHLSS